MGKLWISHVWRSLERAKIFLTMIESQYFNHAVIKNKKIINEDLCMIDFKIENWNGEQIVGR